MLKHVRRDGMGRQALVWLAAALSCAASLAIRWPGIVTYDGVWQYGQALDGDYADWHPPIMARAWSLLNHIHGGSAPFFLIQMLLWWGGLGALAAALARRGRGVAASLVLLVGAAPLFLGWATVVIKDAQMACALVAATGLVAHWRLDGRAMPKWASVSAALSIAYATLARGNALFATVPLGLALAGWGGIVSPWRRAALAPAVMAAVLAVSPFVNHRLFGARASHVERALLVYDLAGIAHHARLATIPGLPPAAWREAEGKGCYTPYFWNPYGTETQCGAIGDAIAFGAAARPHPVLRWAGRILRHPLAYAWHRAGHLNDTLRFWVADGEPDGAPQTESEPNDLGLGAPSGAAGRGLVAAAGWMLRTPFGWPCAWLAASLALLWAGLGGGGQAALGRALALSSASMSASFAVVSIASDLRYHLWSMVAAALALILLVDAGALDRRRARLAALGVAAAVLLGGAARLGLAAPVYVPSPPRASRTVPDTVPLR